MCLALTVMTDDSYLILDFFVCCINSIIYNTITYFVSFSKNCHLSFVIDGLVIAYKESVIYFVKNILNCEVKILWFGKKCLPLHIN